MRVIRLIAPNNESYFVEFESKENELRSLISMLTGIPSKDIKGICDKYGTNYTLSFAVKSPMINSDFSDYYYLIHKSNTSYCTPNYFQMNMNTNTNMNMNHSIHPGLRSKNTAMSPPPISMSEHPQTTQNTQYRSIPPTNRRPNRQANNSYVQVSSYNLNSNPGYTTDTQTFGNYYPQNLQSQNFSSFPINNTSFPQNNSFFVSPQQDFNSSTHKGFQQQPNFPQSSPTNYPNYQPQIQFNTQANQFRNPQESNNQFHQRNYERNISSNQSKRSNYSDIENKEDMEKYLNVVKYLKSSHLINQTMTISLQKHITEERIEVINLFKSFLADELTFKEFLFEIEDVISNISSGSNNDPSRPTTAKPLKKSFLKFIEGLHDNIFEEKSDLNILKNLAMSNYNEIIKSSWEVFSSDKDFENFVDTLRRIISYHKQQSRSSNSSEIQRPISRDIPRNNQAEEKWYNTSKYFVTSNSKNEDSTFTVNQRESRDISVNNYNNYTNFNNINNFSGENFGLATQGAQGINQQILKLQNDIYLSLKQNPNKNQTSNTNNNPAVSQNSQQQKSETNLIKNIGNINMMPNDYTNKFWGSELKDPYNKDQNTLNAYMQKGPLNVPQQSNQINSEESNEKRRQSTVSKCSNNSIDNIDIYNNNHSNTAAANPGNVPQNKNSPDLTEILKEVKKANEVREAQNFSNESLLLNKKSEENIIHMSTRDLTAKINNSNFVMYNPTISLASIPSVNKTNNNDKSMISTNPNMNLSPKKISFDENLGKFLKKNLHTWQVAVVNYFLSKDLPQKEEIIQKKSLYEKDEVYIRAVKNICYQFINDYVIKGVPKHASKITELINKRTANVTKAFKSFFDTRSLEALKEDLVAIVEEKSNESNKTPPMNTSLNTGIKPPLSPDNQGAQNSQDQLQTQYSKSEISPIQKSEAYLKNSPLEFEKNEKGYLYANTLKLINKLNFLKPDEKTLFEKLLFQRDPLAVEAVEDYLNTNNFQKLKNAIQIIYIKKHGPNDPKLPSRLSNNSLKNIQILSNDTENQLKSHIIKSEDPKLGQSYKLVLGTFEKTIGELAMKNEISYHHHALLCKRMSNQDEVLQSIWEAYCCNDNLKEFIDSIEIFTTYYLHQEFKPHKKQKIKISDILKQELKSLISMPEDANISLLKNKESRIVECLVKDNIIDSKLQKTLDRLVINEDTFIYSIFEIFINNKDIFDLIESLEVLARLNFNKDDAIKEFCNSTSNSSSSESESENKPTHHHHHHPPTNQNNLENSAPKSKNNYLEEMFSKIFRSYKYSNVFTPLETSFLKTSLINKESGITTALTEYLHDKDDEKFKSKLQVILKYNRPPITSSSINNKTSQKSTTTKQTSHNQNENANVNAISIFGDKETKEDEQYKSVKDSSVFKALTPQQVSLLNSLRQKKDSLLDKIVTSYFKHKDDEDLQENLILIFKKFQLSEQQKNEKQNATSAAKPSTSSNVMQMNLLENNKEKKMAEYTQLFEDFLKKEKFGNNQMNYLKHLFYFNNEPSIISALESYKKYKDYDDFKESIELILNKNQRISAPITNLQHESSKTSQHILIKTTSDSSQANFDPAKAADSVEASFIRVIDKLHKKYNLDPADINMFKDRFITHKDNYLISAFDSYEKYKDESDFIESLEIYINKHKKNLSDTNAAPPLPEPEDLKSKFKRLMTLYSEKKGKLKAEDFEILVELLRNKDALFLSSLESYDKHKDNDDFQENLELAIKKIKEKRLQDEKKYFNVIKKYSEHVTLTSNQIFFLRNQCKTNGFLKASIESYERNKDFSDLSESLDMILLKFKESSQGNGKGNTSSQENKDTSTISETSNNGNNLSTKIPNPKPNDNDQQQKFLNAMRQYSKKYKIKENDFNILQISFIKNKQGSQSYLFSAVDSYLKSKDENDFKESLELIVSSEQKNLRDFLLSFLRTAKFQESEQTQIIDKFNSNNKQITQYIIHYLSNNSESELKKNLLKEIKKDDKYTTEEREILTRFNNIIKKYIDQVKKIDQKVYDKLKRILIEDKNKELIAAIENYYKTKDIRAFSSVIDSLK